MLHALQREHGLPQSSVQTIIQTRDGYLWFGTEQGLARYNGVGIASFGNWNTPAIIGNDIQTLFEDRHGVLWIGSHGHGILRFRDGVFEALPNKLSNPFVWSIAEDADGGIWVGTDGGLNRIHNGRVTVFTTTNGLPDDTVYAVLVADDGTIWAGTRSGLTSIRNGRMRTYTTGDGLPHDSVRTLHQDRSGGIWIGTLGGGVARLQQGKFTIIGAREGLPNLHVFAILEDGDGSVWIGTGGGGLARAHHGRVEVLTSENGLVNDTVLSLLEDAEGSLWVGTDGGGATVLKDSKFITLTKADGLSHDVVISIHEDRRGDLWLGTLGGGVNRVSGGTIRSFTTRDGLSSDMVFSVTGDRSGAIWIGTHDGLNRFDQGRFTVYRQKDGLASNAVSVIYEDRAGALWFGTPDGLSRFRDGRFTTYTTKDGLPADFVLAVLEDRQGTVWIGTAAGLARFDGGKFTTLTTKDGLADDLIMALHEDADGVLWVATRKGLSRVAAGKITSYTRKDGLVDDLILATIDDQNGSLWVSSNNGVFRMSKRQLKDFAEGRIPRIDATAFGIADGLRSNECNGGVQPSAWRTRDGVLWFPTVKGAAFIDPRRIRTNTVPPPVKIEAVVADERPLPTLGPVRVAAGTHRLEVQYAGLSFAAPDRVRFRTMLEGFDRDWIEAGTKRTAVYTNLAPGQYVFRVAAANGDGRWSSVPALLSIDQEPFFYQTLTFAALCTIGAIALVAYLFMTYVRRIEAEYSGKLAERGRIARDLHDTLAQELVGVQLQLNLARLAVQSDPETCQRHIARASEVSQASLREVRRVLADLRASALDEDPIGAALRRFAALATDGTPTRAEVVVHGKPRALPTDMENDLLRIGQEAITNALRHAKASRVDVDLTYLRKHVHLRVRDDGVGSGEHDLEALKGHYGVAGMRERATRMSARFRMTSRVDAGTEISVEVKA